MAGGTFLDRKLFTLVACCLLIFCQCTDYNVIDYNDFLAKPTAGRAMVYVTAHCSTDLRIVFVNRDRNADFSFGFHCNDGDDLIQRFAVVPGPYTAYFDNGAKYVPAKPWAQVVFRANTAGKEPVYYWGHLNFQEDIVSYYTRVELLDRPSDVELIKSETGLPDSSIVRGWEKAKITK